MTCRNIQLMTALAALLCTSGCMHAEAPLASAATEDTAPPDVDRAHIALHRGTASADADEIDGYCERGLGVYLSATAEQAELTVYVVAPAQVATFEHPVLRVTSQRDGVQETEVGEFESVTLEAGESWVFSKRAKGSLVNVVAEVRAL